MERVSAIHGQALVGECHAATIELGEVTAENNVISQAVQTAMMEVATAQHRATMEKRRLAESNKKKKKAEDNLEMVEQIR
ncbi:hypothetical protein OROHE_019123 [Orobanche hederae]